MAKKIDLEVTLNTELKKVGGSIDSLKKAGAFSGEAGAKQLNSIQAALASLQKVDLSKLKGTELTKFLNDLAKLRQYLDTAARGLTNFSEDYKKALDKVEAATKKAALAQDRLATANERQLEATKKSAEGIKQAIQDGFKYKNTATGGYLRNPEAIAKAHAAGNLEVYSSKSDKPLRDAALNAHLQKVGIPDLASTIQETDNLKQAFKEAEDEVRKFTAELEGTPTGGDLNPTTKEVVEESTGTRRTIADIKDWANQETEDSIKGINDETARLNLNLDKQSGSLGKAFRQFTLFAIGLRMVKKALREAVGTIKEIDRALTEQAMVTGLTRKQTYGLLKDYQNMASRLGATTKEVSSTMTEFLRQGRSIAEATKLTEAAVAAAKVAGISAADSINYLTTAINGFRLSAAEAMKVSDKFAAVAATAAVSYEEIAVALSKVAAQANLAGMSIDYTTALLTKGIETTREAPETIGTALKTVIARMRELGDYGETLEGDTDVNNVETQLAYIGIQLRDNNGELRSTEDVLNDLGAQWDNLNANQQAAIAKALAGTRQQSRLIAMMQDYERVTELQQIAERSAGATMAQMATYLEGMDAALNRVNVAWEKIVSGVTNSDVVISIVDTVATILDNLGSFLETQQGIITGLVTISVLGLTILGNKMRELEVSKLQQRYNLEQQKVETQKNIEKQKELVTSLKQTKEEAKKRILLAEQRKAQLGILAAKIQEMKANGAITTASETWLKKEQAANEEELQSAKEEYELASQQLPQEERKLEIYQKQATILQSQDNLINNILSGFTGLIIPVMALVKLYQALTRGIATAIILKKKENAETQKGTLLERTKAAWEMAGSAANIPVAGWVIAGAILAAILGITIAAAVSLTNKNENAADSINKMSANIYELNKKATELQTVIDKFDELDKKVIKTNKDLEEMSSLLASAGDSLTDDEQETYNKMQTDAGKRDYLQRIIAKTKEDLANARNEQRATVLNTSNLYNLLHSSDSEWASSRDAIYALNNAELYKLIDNTQDLDETTEKLIQTLLEELSVEEALAVLREPSKIADYIKSVRGYADAFMDESQSLKDRVHAYEELKDSIDSDLVPALQEAYSEWEHLSKLEDSTLDWLEKIRATPDDINDFAKAMRDIGIESGKELDYIEELAAEISDIGLSAALKEIFGEDAQKMLIAYEKAFGTTLLNMGQDMEKFTNKIDSVYEKAAAWNTISATERTQFMSENADMFKGESGQDLLNAFNSGDYQKIAEALANNDALKEERKLLLENLDIQLEIEYAREEKNYAHIQELEEYKAHLEDLDNLYLASLETRLKQQQDQLDAYKDYLQKENDALTESLEKRKEAYQKYFDDINQEIEDEEYEDKAMTLIGNISKLSSSTNADAMAKTADLTQQLEELEKERLQELRTRAQELVIQNIEDEVSVISDNLEKLLNNEQALLMAMTKDAQSPAELIAAMMSAEAAKGNNTELGMESYLQQLESTFKVLTPGFNWDDIDVVRQGDSLFLNIAGQNIDLTNNEQQTIYDAIFKALKDIGKF